LFDDVRISVQSNMGDFSKLPNQSNKPTGTFRGKSRSEQGSLSRITVTIPDELLEQADLYVLQRRRGAKGFNRSALIEEALRSLMDRESS